MLFAAVVGCLLGRAIVVVNAACGVDHPEIEDVRRAILDDDFDAVKRFIKRGAPVYSEEYRASGGQNLLELAISQGNADIVGLLMRNEQADKMFSWRNREGDLPMDVAGRTGYGDVIDAINHEVLSRKSRPGIEMVMQSIAQNDVLMLEHFLSLGAPVYDEEYKARGGQNPLELAIQKDNVEIVKCLLREEERNLLMDWENDKKQLPSELMKSDGVVAVMNIAGLCKNEKSRPTIATPTSTLNPYDGLSDRLFTSSVRADKRDSENGCDDDIKREHPWLLKKPERKTIAHKQLNMQINPRSKTDDLLFNSKWLVRLIKEGNMEGASYVLQHKFVNPRLRFDQSCQTPIEAARDHMCASGDPRLPDYLELSPGIRSHETLENYMINSETSFVTIRDGDLGTCTDVSTAKCANELLDAISALKLKEVEELLNRPGVSVNYDLCDEFSPPPLFAAIETNNVDIMRLLLDRGASLSARYRDLSPCRYAIRHAAKWEEMVEILKGVQKQRWDNEILEYKLYMPKKICEMPVDDDEKQLEEEIQRQREADQGCTDDISFDKTDMDEESPKRDHAGPRRTHDAGQ